MPSGTIEIVTAGTDDGITAIPVGPAPVMNTGSLVAKILAATVTVLKVLVNYDTTSDTPVVANVDATTDDPAITGDNYVTYTIDDSTKKTSTFTSAAAGTGATLFSDVSAAVKPAFSLASLVNAIEADLKSKNTTSAKIYVDQAAGTVAVYEAAATFTGGAAGLLGKVAIEKAAAPSGAAQTFE